MSSSSGSMEDCKKKERASWIGPVSIFVLGWRASKRTTERPVG